MLVGRQRVTLYTQSGSRERWTQSRSGWSRLPSSHLKGNRSPREEPLSDRRLSSLAGRGLSSNVRWLRKFSLLGVEEIAGYIVSIV